MPGVFIIYRIFNQVVIGRVQPHVFPEMQLANSI